MPKIDEENFKLPRCEFYHRFTDDRTMTESKRWNTYHRSTYKRLEGLNTTAYSFKAKKTEKPDKTGNYHNPFFFKQYAAAVKSKKPEPIVICQNNRYDDFLSYQHKMADYIAQNIRQLGAELKPKIKANADNEYTCVLIQFPKPDRKIKDTDWANFCIIYFVAISNYLSERRGLNTEIVRRSGFGHLRPSIAETSPSIRINVGCIPQLYANVLIDTTFIVNHILATNHDLFKQAIEHKALEEDFRRYNLTGKGRNHNLSVQPTLWENFWAPMDSMNHSFIYQVMRQEKNVEHVINLLMNQLRAQDIDIIEAAKNKEQIREILVSPWVDIFHQFHLSNDNKMTIELNTNILEQPFQWRYNPIAVEDPNFWEIVTDYIIAFNGHKIDQLKDKSLQGLHTTLEKLSQDFFFEPIGIECEDGYGSDSDCEGEYDKADHTRENIYTKKFITATGMRSIQMAFASVKLYMNQLTGLNWRNLKFESTYMYYESPVALKNHSISIELENINDLAQTTTLTLFDLNHCNTKHKTTPKIETLVNPNFQILIIDTTSSTMKQTASTVKALLNTFPELSTIISVSSGMKNEQAGSDLNPYGTIRIFSRHKEERESIYRILGELEERVGYKHPKKSHLLRINAKINGMVPENKIILSEMAKP